MNLNNDNEYITCKCHIFLKIFTQLTKIIILLILIIHLFYSIIYNKKSNNNESNIYKYKSTSKSLNNQNFINFQNNYSIIKNDNSNFFFLYKQGELKQCKNYGIFIYNYPFIKPKAKLGNIGDYIQSLAALQYLPKNCIPVFVDRDDIENYNSSNSIIIIMNGWNRIKKGNRRISDKIYPIYVSYHINNIKYIDDVTINNFKKYQPIGCRDIFTKIALENKGINAYFSSCLTTTLDIGFSIKEDERTNEIIFIDYRFGRFPKADKYIKSLNSYNFNKVIHTKHMFNINYSHIDRFRLAKKLLERYARAKLVISTRIHGALPCLALKTPVIFVNKKYDKRFPGLYELLNTVGINYKGEFRINVKLNNNNLVVNPKKYLKFANRLKERIKAIIQINKKYFS